MARRRRAPVRPIIPDPLFESEVIAKFILRLMKKGKKSGAERIVYGALDKLQFNLLKNQSPAVKNEATEQKQSEGRSKKEASVKKKAVKDIVELSRTDTIFTSAELREFALKKFEEVLEKLSPLAEVRSRRVGGATYQVPVEVRSKRRLALAMRWLIQNAAARNEKNMILRLAHEMSEALEGRGGAVKQKENTHRMVKANQAFAHYGW